MAKQLDMGSTTIGYSKEGVTNLKNAIKSRIELNAKNIDPNTSTSYKSLIETLRAYWDGNDEANFEADLKQAATDLATALRSYSKIIEGVLTTYASKFAKFQDQAYAKGSIKIKI